MSEQATVEKEKVTMKIDGERVIMKHNTKTASGLMAFETTFDFTNVSHEQLLRWAADQRKIAWRASAGVKKLTNAEIIEKGLQNVTVDCSKTIERVKHVETEDEKMLKAFLKEAVSEGKSIKDILAMLQAKKDEAAAQTEEEELSAGETTE